MAIPNGRLARTFRASIRPLLAAALVLPGAVAVAAMQDAAGEMVSVDRLRFERKCFFEVSEWKGKGEQAFLTRLAEQQGIYESGKAKAESLADFEKFLAETYYGRFQELKDPAVNDVPGASAMASLILRLAEKSKDPDVTKWGEEADEFNLAQNFQKAQGFLAKNDLDQARAGFVLCARTRNKAKFADVVANLVKIEKTRGEFDRIMTTNDLAQEGTMLDAVLASVREDLKERFDVARSDADLKSLETARDEIARTTQSILVSVLDVSKALAGFKATAVDLGKMTFSLTPSGPKGKRFPLDKGVTAGEIRKFPFLWYRGTYDVKVYAGGKTPFATVTGVVMEDAVAALQVPGAAPDGMVWVPAPASGGTALFVDRTEVTVQDVKAVAGSDPKLLQALKDSNQGDADPVWFADEETALAYEKASGKRIPTVEQWLQAAYGPFNQEQRRYPWGNEPPDGTRVFANKGADQPVAAGGRPAGASIYGALDMAGNLAEWVRKGGQLWLLGGWYQMGEEGLLVLEGKCPVRDPMPGKTAFDAMGGSEQNQYSKYRYKVGEDGYLTGLRMVIPVPTK